MPNHAHTMASTLSKVPDTEVLRWGRGMAIANEQDIHMFLLEKERVGMCQELNRDLQLRICWQEALKNVEEAACLKKQPLEIKIHPAATMEDECEKELKIQELN